MGWGVEMLGIFFFGGGGGGVILKGTESSFGVRLSAERCRERDGVKSI